MAELVGTTPQTLRIWAKEGIDITDERAVRERAKSKEIRGAAAEDMQGVKLRKLTAEANLKEHELEVERGKVVPKEQVLSEGMRMGMVIKGIFLKLSSDLAPVLAGRPAGEIKTALDKYAREKLTELSLYESPIKIVAD